MDLPRNTSKWDRRVNAAAGRLRTSDRVVDAQGARPSSLIPAGLAAEDVVAAEALIRAASINHPFEATLLVRRHQAGGLNREKAIRAAEALSRKHERDGGEGCRAGR